MFEKFGQAAEQMATSVSRRLVLGRLGKGALGLAAFLVGMAGVPAQASEGSCCRYRCGQRFCCRSPLNGRCYQLGGCTFVGLGSCFRCPGC